MSNPNLGWLETSFVVADVERTSAYYQALGFAVVDTADEGRCVTLEAGDTRVALFQGILDPAETQLIFWNGDVEAMVRETRRGARRRDLCGAGRSRPTCSRPASSSGPTVTPQSCCAIPTGRRSI